MKKYILSVYLLLILAVFSLGNSQADAAEPNNLIRSGVSLWQTLENLNGYEKENSLIDIECGPEAESQASLIEEKWNSGKFNEAIELSRILPGLEDAAIGIQWKEPIKTKLRWGDDVLIGSRDSIVEVDFDVDNSTGNLFAVLKYQNSGNYWSINISSDTGKTWTEKYISGANTSDIDGAVLGNYFYIAYSTTTGVGQIRRFDKNTGDVDNSYGYLNVIVEASQVIDIALTSNVDFDNNLIFYWAIMSDGSLRMYWDDTLATSWPSSNPSVGNASRGLDACCDGTTGAANLYTWASYVGTDDSLYAVARYPWNYFGPLEYVGVSSEAKTSISMYLDTVIISLPRYDSIIDRYTERYARSYDEGASWNYGSLANPSYEDFLVSDVTARNGDGFGIVYQGSTGNVGGIYRHKGYPTSPWWTTPLVFTDTTPGFNIKPSIERIASGLYGIVYVDQPEKRAWFDRSDWISGIEEKEIPDKDIAYFIGPKLVIFSGQTDVGFYIPEGNSDNSLEIYDITGSHVITLAKGMPAGINSATWFAINKKGKAVPSGTYLCVLKSGRSIESSKLTLIK